MGYATRKKWLLELWEYHNGSLRPDEVEGVEARMSVDPNAKTDSQRVLGIINELRQEGRWETHPEFPSQMVDRILQMERGGGVLRWAVLAAVGLLLLLYLLFGRGDSAAQGVTGTISHVRDAFFALFERPPEFAPTSQFDTSQLRLGHRGKEGLYFPEEWIPSSSLELDDRVRPRPTLHLEDPVPQIEEDLEAMFNGGFMPPAE